MSRQDALLRIAASAVDAVAEVLKRLAPGEVEASRPTVAVAGRDPLDGLALPVVTASVAYVEGGQGGHHLAIPLAAARRLVTGAQDADGEADLTGDELSSFTEAIAEVMESAAAATGALLRDAVQVDEPAIATIRSRADLRVNTQGATRAVVADITLFGEQCRLVQLIPTLFTMRAEQAMATTSTAASDDFSMGAIREALREVPLRVWAEIGRAGLRSVEAAGLADGAIIELDRNADDPIDVYVNGSRIGTGRLVANGDEWAVRLEQVFPVAQSPGRS